MTISLRAVCPADERWLDTWYPAAVLRYTYEPAVAHGLMTLANNDASFRARIIVRDGTDVGVVTYRLRTPAKTSARFECVLTPPEHARKGAGMAAATLAEQEMLEAGMCETYAPAPAINGISMYFWIRLGYAPLQRDAWPLNREGVAWLRRPLV